MNANRWKPAAAAGWAVVGALALAGAGGDTEEVVTRRLVIQDGQGRDRIVMECRPGFGPQIAMKDGEGRLRVGLTVLPSGAPVVALYDRPGAGRVVLNLSPGTDTPSVMVQDSAYRHSARLVADDGAARIEVDGHPFGR